ncbi:MAG: hypothetical protein WDO69_32610 [Pseudomonadota bacterium]
MSSSAFDTIARNWGDSVADRLRSYLSKQETDLPIRVRIASDFVRVSRDATMSIFQELERASVVRAASLPLCSACDEVIEASGDDAPECDLCERIVRDGKTETCFLLRSPVLYRAPSEGQAHSLAEPTGSEPYASAEAFEDMSWEALDAMLPVDALLMTATKVELQAVRSHLRPPTGRERVLRVPWKESTYYLGRIGSYACAVVMSEAGAIGRQGAALTLHDAIARLKPSFAVAVGIAFGHDPEAQAIGDVLISTMVIPYEPARIQPGGNIHRAPHPEVGMILLNRLRTLDSEEDFGTTLRFGPMLSGEKLVDDPEFKDHLFKTHPTAIGGEMEAAGIYAAAARNRLEWIVLKAICDWGDGKKDKTHQKAAAANACAVMEALLSRAGLERSVFVASDGTTPQTTSIPSMEEMPVVEVTENPGFRSTRPGRTRRRR